MNSSPFSRLSAELRNEIYELNVILPQPIVHSQPGISSATQDKIALPGLLHSCRQIREECQQMFYASNTFTFRCDAWRSQMEDNDCIDWIHSWLDDVGEKNCAMLGDVNIDLGRHTERMTGRTTLPIENRHAVWQIYQLAPRIARLASRFPLLALSISSSWLVECRVQGCRFEQRSLVEAKNLRLFQQNCTRTVPHIDSEHAALRNTAINDAGSAVLAGGSRNMLTILVLAIWRSCCYKEDDFDRGHRSLQAAFESIDTEEAKIATALLADDHRGYPIPQSSSNHVQAALRAWVIGLGR